MSKCDCVTDDTLKLNWKWLPAFSKPTMKKISYVFIAAVLAEASWLAIQLHKTYKTKSTEDLSLESVIIIVVSNVVWIFYALALRNGGILLSGILYVILSTLLMINVLRFS